jgi:hypothetical protein
MRIIMEQYDDLLSGSWDIVAAIRHLAARITDLEREMIRLQGQQPRQPEPNAKQARRAAPKEQP